MVFLQNGASSQIGGQTPDSTSGGLMFHPILQRKIGRHLVRMQKMHFLLNGMNFQNGGLEQDFQIGGTMM